MNTEMDDWDYYWWDDWDYDDYYYSNRPRIDWDEEEDDDWDKYDGFEHY